MLVIKTNKSEKTKGVLLPPIASSPISAFPKAYSSGASTSLKDVLRKHASVLRANITGQKHT